MKLFNPDALGMKKLLVLWFVFVSGLSYGQITGVVRDSVSNEAIRYVNIWVENEDIGTTSDEGGAFTLKANDKSKTIVFSAVGYETKKMSAASIKGAIVLKPKTTLLDEVVVKASKKKYKMVIGTFKEAEIAMGFASHGLPWIIARYFEFDERFQKTPYISKIRIWTDSDIKDSKFNVRLYAANEKGEPGVALHDKNIIGIAGKGERKTEIDIASLNITIPKQGIFIAVEQLIIEANRFEYSYKVTDLGIRSGTSYEPSFGTLLFETDQNSWDFSHGKWHKFILFPDKVKSISDTIPRYKDKHGTIAMELVLTN